MGCASSKQKLKDVAASHQVIPEPDLTWVNCTQWDQHLRLTRKGAAINGFAHELRRLEDCNNFFRLARDYIDAEYPNQAAARTTEELDRIGLRMPNGKHFPGELMAYFVLNDSLINFTYQFVMVIVKDEQMVLHDDGAPSEEKMVIGATLTATEKLAVQEKMVSMIQLFKEDEAKFGQVDIKLIAGNEMWQARLNGDSPEPYRKPLRPGQPKALSRLNTVIRDEAEEKHCLIPTVALRAVYQYTERRFRGNTIWDGGEFPLYVNDKKYEHNTRLLLSRREFRGDITEYGTPYRVKYCSGGPATVPDMLYRSIDRSTELDSVEDLHLIVAIDPNHTWPKVGDYKTSEVFLAAEAALWDEAKRLNDLGIAHQLRLNVHMGVDIERQLFIGDLPTTQKEQCKRTEAFYEGFEDMFNVTLKEVSRNPKSLVKAMERQRKCLPKMHVLQDDSKPLDATTKKWNKWLLKSKRNFVDISFPDITPAPLASVAARRWLERNFNDDGMKIIDMCQPLYIEQPKKNECRLLRGVRLLAVHDSRCDPRTIVGVVATVGIPVLVDSDGEEAPWSRVSIRSVVQAAVLHHMLQWRRDGLLYEGTVKCHIITGEYWRTLKLLKNDKFLLHDDSEHYDERIQRALKANPKARILDDDPPVPPNEVNFHRGEKPKRLSLMERVERKARRDAAAPRHEDDLTPEQLENETPEERKKREDEWERLIMKLDSYLMPDVDGQGLPEGAMERRKARLKAYWDKKHAEINEALTKRPNRTVSELERIEKQYRKEFAEREAKLAIQRAEAEGKLAPSTDDKYALAVLEGRISASEDDDLDKKGASVKVRETSDEEVRRAVMLDMRDLSPLEDAQRSLDQIEADVIEREEERMAEKKTRETAEREKQDAVLEVTEKPAVEEEKTEAAALEVTEKPVEEEKAELAPEVTDKLVQEEKKDVVSDVTEKSLAEEEKKDTVAEVTEKTAVEDNKVNKD